MENLKKVMIWILVIVAVAIAAFLGGQFAERSSERAQREETITSQTLINRIQEQSFLVTKTVFIEQESEIIIDTGSDWSNLWWGQTITAEGLIRIDVGVDLSALAAEQISVNHDARTIEIELGNAEILDTSLQGEIEVVTKSGLLKKLFLSDTNADYNLALTQLTADANSTVAKDTELIAEAREATMSMLTMLLANTNYEVRFK